MKTLRRTLHPETRILDAKKGLVEYVASDETLDSHREVIRAAGWRFTHFQKNAPFVDSHDYSTIDRLLGQVLDFRVIKKQLVETVQWARDVAENTLAQLGWKMTEAGYLKAVSVGFWPVRTANRWDTDRTAYDQQLAELEMSTAPDAQKPRTVYLEQEQIELSAVIIGANPNALAKAYKAGVLDDAALEHFSSEYVRRHSRAAAIDDAPAAAHRARQRQRFLEQLQHTIRST